MGGELIADTFYSPNSVWPCSRLVDCTSDGNISYGIVQPGRNKAGGVPIVRVNNFSQGHLDVTDHMTVDSAIESKHKKTRLEGGEVLLTLVGSTGQSAIVPSSMSGWNVARAIAVIRPSVAVGASWIELCLRSAETKHFLDGRANTTVQKTLNLKDVKEVPIPIPPSSVRGAIEKIATRLDRKIELNRQTNKTLEAMAQALFKSWFVDFDPVIDNALAAGNDIPEPFKARAAARQALGDARKPLPEEIRREFPDGFEFRDEMGWVPRGWEFRSLKDVANILNGHAFKSADYVENGVFLLRTRNFENDGLVHRGNDDVYLSAGFIESHPQYICEAFDFHVVMVGASVGKTSLLLPHILPALRNQNMWCFRAKGNMPSRVYLSSAVEKKVKEVIGWATGSARSFFRKSDFKEHKILVPDTETLVCFQENVETFYEKISINTAESSTLESLRDVLLPKLLSGQLTIPDAEKTISNAT